jgi:HEPN domain-containing protein
MDAREPLLETAVFHCQQAAEKAFKAFLVWHDVPFRRTHSLEEIGEQCLQVDPGLTELVDAAAPLGEYAWRYRYPGEVEHLGPDEVTEALDVSNRVLLAVKARLDSDDDFQESRLVDSE